MESEQLSSEIGDWRSSGSWMQEQSVLLDVQELLYSAPFYSFVTKW
jgi:hypothetical protein